jgi:hypothetical protein
VLCTVRQPLYVTVVTSKIACMVAASSTGVRSGGLRAVGDQESIQINRTARTMSENSYRTFVRSNVIDQL